MRLGDAVLDVALDVLGLVEVRLLLEHADGRAGRELGLAAVLLVEAGHDPQQRGLARAVVAEHADLGAGEERQRDVVEDRLVGGCTLRQAVHREDVLGGHRQPRIGASRPSARVRPAAFRGTPAGMPAPPLPPSCDAVVVGSGPERPGRRDHARRGGPRRCSCSRPPATPGGAVRDRGAHAARLPPRRVLLRLPGGARRRRCSRACRWSATGCAGCTRAPAGAPAADGGRGGRALPRPRRDRGASLDAASPGRRRARGARSPGRTLDALRRACAATMLARLPARRRARCSCCAALGPRGTLELRPAAAPARARGARPAAVRGRRRARRGCTARPMHGDVPPRRRRAARSPPSTSTCSATPSAGRARAAAPARLADALVGLPARARRRRVRTGARVDARARAAAAASRGVRARRRRARARADIVRRRRHAARAARARRRRARRTPTARRLRRYRYGPATVKVDWALDGPIPWAAPEVARRRAPCTSAATRGRVRCDASTRRRRAACPSGRSCCSASSRSPTRRARRRASTPPGPTRTARRGVDWAAERDAPRRAHGGAGRALRARLPRPHPRPPRARPRPTCERRNANLVGGDVGGGSYALDQLVFRPCRRSRPTARRCAACTWAARRPSPAARSTASPAAPPRARGAARRRLRR